MVMLPSFVPSTKSPGMAGMPPPPHLLFVTALLLVAVMPTPGTGLDCYQCGMYNDGVGSITHCLNYSEALAHRYLRKCPRDSDNFCIVKGFATRPHMSPRRGRPKWKDAQKYVSELSIVRDCVAQCKEKEVWDTRTYCCSEDGCNPATVPSIAIGGLIVSAAVTLLFTIFLH